MAGPSSAAHPPLDSCGGPTNWNGTHACAGRPCRRREGVGQASGPTARQGRLRLARPQSQLLHWGKGRQRGQRRPAGPDQAQAGISCSPLLLGLHRLLHGLLRRGRSGRGRLLHGLGLHRLHRLGHGCEKGGVEDLQRWEGFDIALEQHTYGKEV